MICINEIPYIKKFCEQQADIIPGGVIYLVVEGDTFTWKKASKAFDLDVFEVDKKISSQSIVGRAIREKRTIEENVPRALYGMRLQTIAEPIVDENGETVGAFSTVIPKLHPVAKAFNDFAPIIAEMFPEGAVLLNCDLQKIVHKQASSQFDIPSLTVGTSIEESVLAKKVISSGKPAYEELDRSVHGVPVLMSCYPLFDEDDNSVVATLNLAIPKEIAGNLREISGSIESELEGISAAIQQLTASASEIHSNEQDLNEGITKVTTLSDKIEEVSSFISSIATETNLLGLNAAIEAARAGEAGRGFGVVAQQIRKLSEQSKSTVPEIKKLTDSIRNEIEESSKKSQQSLSASQEQAASTEEMNASIEEITAKSIELNKIAAKL